MSSTVPYEQPYLYYPQEYHYHFHQEDTKLLDTLLSILEKLEKIEHSLNTLIERNR
jgi:hypothetical protein